MTTAQDASRAAPELSIIAPAFNEEDNVTLLVEQVEQSVINKGVDAELIVVDDCSTDATWTQLCELSSTRAWLRPVRLKQNRGQSKALGVGVELAQGRFIATLDADLQNDPADLPKMLAVLQRDEADFVQGWRANRHDIWSKRQASKVGKWARRLVLADPVKDTGCSTRVVRADIARHWPLQFKGMHRFMPIYAAMLGARIFEVPVNHRHRYTGASKYKSLQRGVVGFFDLLVMRWMMNRYRNDPGIQTPGIQTPGIQTPGIELSRTDARNPA
jgi:glycosyltransferase involved in cell wall biosynthesis